MTCEHFWRTVEEIGYGWVSICENCGQRESAEHAEACEAFMARDGLAAHCSCGAAEEFKQYEARKGLNDRTETQE